MATSYQPSTRPRIDKTTSSQKPPAPPNSTKNLLSNFNVPSCGNPALSVQNPRHEWLDTTFVCRGMANLCHGLLEAEVSNGK